MLYHHVNNLSPSRHTFLAPDSGDVKLEIFTNASSGQIGIMLNGVAVGSIPKQATQEILQYLVNHNRIDLEEVAEAKRVKDSDECTCVAVKDHVKLTTPCLRHFRV